MSSDTSDSEKKSTIVVPTFEETVDEEVLKQIVYNIDPQLEIINYKGEAGSNVGDNYMSLMYAVSISTTIKGGNANEGEKKDFQIMLKTMPTGEWRISMIKEFEIFSREGKMYSGALNDLLKFQTERGLPENEIFRGFPKTYYSSDEILAMENLKIIGYKIADRVKGLDYAHSSLSLRQLAKYHAISYAKFKGDGDAMRKEYPYLIESFIVPPDTPREKNVFKSFAIPGFKTTHAGLLKEGHVKEAEIFEQIFKDEEAEYRLFEKIFNYVDAKIDTAIICHGDCWVNNMMFKYDDKTGIPIDSKFVDFQIARAGSRMLDIGYFMFSSVERNLFNAREQDLLKEYFETFNQFAIKLGSNPNAEIFKWENFIEEYENYKYFGIVFGGFLLAPFMASNKEDTPDMGALSDIHDEAKTAEMMGKTWNSEIEKRILNLINHFDKCRK